MSSLQDVLQENGIDFVINRKYQRDTVDMSLVSLTFRLYNFNMDTLKETMDIIEKERSFRISKLNSQYLAESRFILILIYYIIIYIKN